MDHEAARESLVDRLAARDDVDRRTLAALRAVPRHAFVPGAQRDQAYRDRPLPIGEGQTISAPHMVAIMTTALDAGAGDRVLEVGTGCGYHAAVTAEVVGDENVFSVEYVASLADRAHETLERVGYGGVSVRAGDGHDGWPEHAPYDAAYLTCAAPEIPPTVLEQVREGGRVVAPVGGEHGRQELVVARWTPQGVDRDRRGPVRFVPMRGGDGPRD